MQHVIENALRGLVDDLKAGKFSTDLKARKSQATPKEMRQLLVSCLLSSGWKYEKALAASIEFCKLFPHDGSVPTSDEVEHFLRGRTVRHRFPNSKAKQVHISLVQFELMPKEILFTGGDLYGERVIRDLLHNKLSGFGYKQTSMFMRDIGASKNLAIIDSHVIWYVTNVLGIKFKSLTQRQYLEIEEILQLNSEHFDIDLNSLDVLIWVLVREFKKNERAISCGTQYVLPLAA